MRTPDLRRSLLFVAGADSDAHATALLSRPDVLIQDLEDSTPPERKETARQLAASLFNQARAHGVIPAVRVNLLSGIGMADLTAVILAKPALIFLPKAESAAQISLLAQEIERLERLNGLPLGHIEIVPNAETALGVVNLKEIVLASARVKSCLIGTEDLAASLLAERSPDAEELAYARSRFLLECRALGIEPIDAPYTYSDVEGCERETRRSRRLGYRCKSAVAATHIEAIHRVLTPGADEISLAKKIVAAFDIAQAEGRDRPLVDGLWIEPPAYLNSQRLLARARQLEAMERC